MSKKQKGKLTYVFQTINIIPLFFFGIMILLLAFHWFTKAMHEEVEVELKNLGHSIAIMLDEVYPGDYQLVGTEAYELYKGEHNLTYDYSLIDRIKYETGIDITLFYQDTRVQTTIFDNTGKRFIGTAAPGAIIADVLQTGECHFYDNIIINNQEYFAHYMPLFHSNDSIAGMLFVGKPSAEVSLSVQKTLYPLALAGILVMILAATFMFLYTRSFTSSLSKIHRFLTTVSGGNLNATLDGSILRRNDELGDIGRSAITMQRSLRTLVEQDTLTELFNRRSGHYKLGQVIKKSTEQQTPFCIALGDIDFFKKINDTYGHNCGDIILTKVSEKLRNHMFHCGYAIRWGGEEFLLIFDNMGMKEAHQVLEEIMEDIRNMETLYEEEIVKVTMTFGLVCGDDSEIKHLIQQADDRLYEGKARGRNRIVV